MAKKKSTKGRAQQKRRQKQSEKAKARAKAKAATKRRPKATQSRDIDEDPVALPGRDPIGIPSRLSMESAMANLMGPRGDDPVSRAQQVMYEAWDAPSPRQAIRLAKEAIKISPDCADAYNLLAEVSARTLEERAEWYRTGVAAGERALGEEFFEQNVGHFWGILDTRPYMRARNSLARCLWELGKRDEAVEHYMEMLRLNPNDNQGLRHSLAAWLLTLDRETELRELLAQHEGDIFAGWSYTHALLSFRSEGDSEESRDLLATAVEGNPHVPAFLLGKKKLPRDLPNYMGVGDENEAIAFCNDYAETWKDTPGALQWLRQNWR